MSTPDFSTHELGEITVLDEGSEPVKLSSLWKERPAALVFVRHFG